MRMTAGIVVFAIGVAAGCNGSLAFGPPAIAGGGISKEDTRAVGAFTRSRWAVPFKPT